MGVEIAEDSRRGRPDAEIAEDSHSGSVSEWRRRAGSGLTERDLDIQPLQERQRVATAGRRRTHRARFGVSAQAVAPSAMRAVWSISARAGGGLTERDESARTRVAALATHNPAALASGSCRDNLVHRAPSGRCRRSTIMASESALIQSDTVAFTEHRGSQPQCVSAQRALKTHELMPLSTLSVTRVVLELYPLRDTLRGGRQ